MKHVEKKTYFVDPRAPGYDLSRSDIATIGFGGGEFDPARKEKPVDAKTAADLVAKFLGINKRPELRGLLKAVRESQKLVDAMELDEPSGEDLSLPENGDKPVLTKIVTHRLAHADEFVAIAIALLYGRGRKWSWTEEPSIVFANDEDEAIQQYGGRPDVLFVGIAGSEKDLEAEVIDEHRARGRLVRTCATKLMAQELGLHTTSLKWLIQKVVEGDTEAGQTTMTLGNVLKVVQEYGAYDGESLNIWLDLVRRVVSAFQRSGQKFEGPLDLALIVRVVQQFGNMDDEAMENIVTRVVVAFRQRGYEFHVRCPRDFENNGKVEELAGNSRLASVTSDAYGMNAWARSQTQATVVVQRYQTGHIRLYSTPGVKREMFTVAKLILAAEMLTRNMSERDIVGAMKSFDGKCKKSNDFPGKVPWYIHTGSEHGGVTLLNGSSSHEREATVLTLEQVIDAVRRGFAQTPAAVVEG